MPLRINTHWRPWLTGSRAHQLTQYALRFFLPWACAGCRGALYSLDDQGFCGLCWLGVPRIQGLVCRTCGIPLRDGGAACFACRRTPAPLIIRSATEYRGVIPPAVHRFKYGGRRTLSRPLGLLMRYGWLQNSELHAAQALIPVPLHSRHEKQRGYNQAELLAAELSANVSVPVLPVLVRTRATRSQVKLNGAERRDNVRAAFAIHPSVVSRIHLLSGRTFLLIDDVCTTASTLGECANVLLGAGAKSVKALVLARDL